MRKNQTVGPGRHLDHPRPARCFRRASLPRLCSLRGSLAGGTPRRRPLRSVTWLGILRRIDVPPRLQCVESSPGEAGRASRGMEFQLHRLPIKNGAPSGSWSEGHTKRGVFIRLAKGAHVSNTPRELGDRAIVRQREHARSDQTLKRFTSPRSTSAWPVSSSTADSRSLTAMF